MRTLKIVKTKGSAPAPKKPAPSLVGKPVRYKLGEHSTEVLGVVKSHNGGVVSVSAAIPNHAGVLYVAKDLTPFMVSVDAVEVVDESCLSTKTVKAFETQDPLENVKAATELKEDGVVVDYRGVTFEGFGSTFQHVTARDRDGDYVVSGAFDQFLNSFKQNPVMLVDHERSVSSLMGHYERVGVTERGLALTGRVTDSPHRDAVHVRYQIVEGSLKTLSIGGFFFYLEDYRGIEEVDLHEVSLVVVPANPDATFHVRSISEDLVVKSFQRYLSKNGGQLRRKSV